MIFNGNAKKTILGMTRCLTPLSVQKMEQVYNARTEADQVMEFETEQGKVLTVEKNNRFYPLNSCYDAEKAAEEWTKQFESEDINENSIIIVYGLSDGKGILKLCGQRPDCRVFVYEPCQEIFWKAMQYEEVAELVQRENVCLIVKGICDEYFFHVLQSAVNYSNYQLVVQAVLPNYLQLFGQEYQEMLDIYKSVVEIILFTRNTIILRGVEIQHNAYGLARDMMESNSITQLVNIMNTEAIKDIPAILVAAGPSLDKNVEDLKKAKGKAFLMVVDTALNTVLEHGIIPDITMSIDSRKPLNLFKNAQFENIPIALSMNSNKEVVKKNHARHFYEVDEQSYLTRIIEKIGKDTMQLPTGGSVANNALSLLYEMGFKTIILVGQDLAYPGGVEHAEAAYGKGNDKIDTKKKDYFEVEDNFGNMVMTEANMNIYRKWIENYIAAYDDLKVINATEGGAKIAGTEFIPLSEAIERYCKKDFDAKQLLDIEPYFTEEERIQFICEIREMPEKIEELGQLIWETQKLYRKVDSLNGKGKHNSMQMKKAMDEIAAYNEKIDASFVSCMLQAYIAQTDYEIQGELLKYKENESALKLINDFVEQGQKLLNAYQDAIEQLKEDLPLIMEDFA